MVFNPKDKLDEMVEQFKRTTDSLMEICNIDEHYVKSQNAIYVRAYCKPNNRLSMLLGINREILVLFTSFTKQQARTISVTKKLIRESSGRLESNLAVIIHCDKGGNSKLRSWGREDGLIILPIYYSADEFPTTDIDFERFLCRERYSHDIFHITGPVSDDTQFYGRRSEAIDIAGKLQTGQVKTCLGIRKIGKTSIINRIVNECIENFDCKVVMIDCSLNGIHSMDDGQLMSAMAKSAREILGDSKKYKVVETISESIDISKGANEIIELLRDAYEPIIFVFDEIDYITPSSPTAAHWIECFNPFWRNLRGVYQECKRAKKSLSLLIGGVSSKWFKEESIMGIENAALSFVPEDYLSPLPRGASLSMIKNLSRVVGLSFDNEAQNLIAETGCDVPFWMRNACSSIHKSIDIDKRPIKVSLKDISEPINNFVETVGANEASKALMHLFKVYPELVQYIERAINGKFEDVSKYYLFMLNGYGLIKMENGGYHINGTLMKEGIKISLEQLENTDDSIQKANISKPYEKLEMSSCKWADELGDISKRRNFLEKELRNQVYAIINYDTLMQNSKNLRCRIEKVLDKSQCEKFCSCNCKELIEEFTWWQLIQIVNKEWKIFEKNFVYMPK